MQISTVAVAVASCFLLFINMASAATAPTANVATTPRVMSKKYKWELDTQAMLANSNFKINPSDLIKRCKEVIEKQIGLEDPNDIAEDFVFQFPIIGPLTKTAYIEAVSGFKLTDTFPDLNAGYCDFRVDPFRPNRVWFTSCFAATHTGQGTIFGKPTGRYVECPPQSISLSFNEAGQVTFFSGGYVMDKTLGNTGGMGGIFGPLYRIGKAFPFPEAKPYSPSWQFRTFAAIGNIAGRISKMTAKKPPAVPKA